MDGKAEQAAQEAGKKTTGLDTKSSDRKESQIHFYASGYLLHCRFCQHNVDWKCAGTCKDHLHTETNVEKQGKHCKKWNKTKQIEKFYWNFYFNKNWNKFKWGKQNLDKNKVDFIGPKAQTSVVSYLKKGVSGAF